MIKQKTKNKFNTWLNEHDNKPFYVVAEKHWDEGTKYYLCAFGQTEETANEIKNMLWQTYVETEPSGFIKVLNAKKDIKFFDEHKDFTFDLHKLHGKKLTPYN